MLLSHDFLVASSTCDTPILCAWSITVSGISTLDSLQIPIIFCKTLSLVSLFSVRIPWNLGHSLLLYCFSSSISCWFSKFCFLISKIWFWSMVSSDSSSNVRLLLCLFSSFVNCNSICFRNFSNKCPHISYKFLSWLATKPFVNMTF